MNALARQETRVRDVSQPLPITAIRLRERMDEIGCTQKDLAEAIGATQGAVSQILTGSSRKSRLLPHIAQNLSVNLNWLLGITDEKIDMFDVEGQDISEDQLAAMKAGIIENRLQKPEQLKPLATSQHIEASAPDSGEDDEIVEVKELDLAFGMGGGSYLDLPVRPKGRKFTRDWLRLFTQSPPSRIFIARGIGDSMSPTIQNDDIVIIDTAQNHVGMGDQIWAVAYGNFGLIKRLRPLPSGGIKIMSDNKYVESEIAYDQELHVIGKVVAVVRKMAG